MCHQIVKFCSDSTKPLLFAGSFLLLLISIAIGYTGCTANALYQDLDLAVAEKKSLTYYLQLIGAIYLALITVFAAFAAYYDQKHSIRALSLVTSINFVLAVAAILMAPSPQDVGNLFMERLTEASRLYNFSDKYNLAPNSTTLLSKLPTTNQTETSQVSERSKRAEASEQLPSNSSSSLKVKPIDNSTEATILWDKLQAHGCCGIRNATEEWKPNIPKSCCLNPSETEQQNGNGKIFVCKTVDESHSRPCIDVIGSTGWQLQIVLALIALINLYLATVSGVSTYRTFHYNEASQNAYS